MEVRNIRSFKGNFHSKKCNVSPCYIITMSPLSLPASVGRLKKLAVRNLLKSFFSSSDKECQRAHIIDSGQRFTIPCQESQGRWFCSLLPYYYFLKVYNTYILQTTSDIGWDLIEHIPYVNNRRREKYEIMYGQNFKDDSDT